MDGWLGGKGGPRGCREGFVGRHFWGLLELLRAREAWALRAIMGAPGARIYDLRTFV